MCVQLALFPLSTSSAAASHAKTSATQGGAKASRVHDRVSGESSRESSAKSARASSSSRTLRRSPVGGSLSSCETLPTSGTWAHGEWSPLPASEHRTSVGDSSSLLPTPTAVEYGRNSGGAKPGHERASRETLARRGLLPTPLASDGDGRGGAGAEEAASGRPLASADGLRCGRTIADADSDPGRTWRANDAVEGARGRDSDREPLSAWCGWEPASAVRRMDDGFSKRVDRPRRRRLANDRHRLKALGNAVVPQVAEVVGRVVADVVGGSHD